MIGAPGVHLELSFAADLTAVAQALGMSEADLNKALDNASIADVAKAHGVDRQVVATALKNTHSAAIDKAVKDGKLPQDIADKLRANLDNEVKMLLDVKRGPGGLFGPIRIEKSIN
jgi:membrane-bound lytic murein transglycosylase B